MKAKVGAALVALLLVALPTVASVAAAGAVPSAAQVCSTLTVNGKSFKWSTVGTGFTCGSAKKYVAKLSDEHFPQKGKSVKLTGGPKGYHCTGFTDDTGRATVGACYLGTVAFPKSGFQWLG